MKILSISYFAIIAFLFSLQSSPALSQGTGIQGSGSTQSSPPSPQGTGIQGSGATQSSPPSPKGTGIQGSGAAVRGNSGISNSKVDYLMAEFSSLSKVVRNCLNDLKDLGLELNESIDSRPSNSASKEAKALYQAQIEDILAGIKKANRKLQALSTKIKRTEAKLNQALARDSPSKSDKANSEQNMSALNESLENAEDTGISLKREAQRAAKH